MEVRIRPSRLRGCVAIPASKSHTIRALLIATCAEGRSVLHNPLASSDTEACIEAVHAFGAVTEENESDLVVHGSGGNFEPYNTIIDVGNSGTSLYLAAGIAATASTQYTFSGDEQLTKRPIGPLMTALNDLGARCKSENGYPPVTVEGPLSGGETSIECPTSQYLSSLLLAAPLASEASRILVPLLYEQPYVEMTLTWLDSQNIEYQHEPDFSSFTITGGQCYHPFETTIPGDFSSATFFLSAAAITGSRVQLLNLDMNDPQGDKAVVEILQSMGCDIEPEPMSITVQGPETVEHRLEGRDIDMNAIPDALPGLAVVGCFASGTTRLQNVPQARLKETDRIAVMHEELSKMGADTEETEDGLIIRESNLRGAVVDGHNDHRIVMALAVAALGAEGETTITSAEAVSITFPSFFRSLREIMEEPFVETLGDPL